jgi:hypothetical protein
MRRLALVGALLGLAAAPVGASARQAVSFGNTRPVAAYEAPVKARGHLVVEFHGDAAAGCQAAHLCDVSGTLTWSPGRGGSLLAYGYSKDGKRVESAFIALGDDPAYGEVGGTSARVRRAVGDGADSSLCADVGSSTAYSDGQSQHGTTVDLSLLGASEVLRTRCAGPLTSDVRSLLPTRSIDEPALRRGGARLDYSADGEFSGHGLAGSVHSDVVLRVGKGRNLLADQPGQTQPPQGPQQRTRFLQVTYRVESVSGQVVTTVHGLTDPDLCGPLDSCGLLGTITTAPASSTGDGVVFAYASAKHSRRDLRRAVGLLPGPPPSGVQRVGYFEWGEGGTVTSDMSRDGAPACSDSAPMVSGGLVDLGFARGHATAHLYSGEGVAGGDPLSTRCPGPNIADAAAGIALGRVTLSQLGAHRATLRLPRGTAFSANGYRSSTRSSLTVGIRRVRVSEQIERDPAAP